MKFAFIDSKCYSNIGRLQNFVQVCIILEVI